MADEFHGDSRVGVELFFEVKNAQRFGKAAAEAPGKPSWVFERYLPLAFVVCVAAATRFLWLGHQSLWYDEIVSLTLEKQPFAAMLHDIARTESTPPLYYVLLWPWLRLFGTTADALRSLSACFGVLTVAVLYFAARLRFGAGTALAGRSPPRCYR